MKSLFALGALVAIAMGASFLLNRSFQPALNAEITKNYLEEGRPTSGMYFSSDYVVSEYEYDDAYCLLYEDADANMFETEIFVDPETYQAVINACEDGSKLVGSLVLNENCFFDGMEVFTYVPSSEMKTSKTPERARIIDICQLSL